MAKQFINPNFHVILIHYPIALLALGTLIELFAPILWRRSTFRAAGRWMILLGALSLAPTALAGLYAMSDVNRTAATADDATWAQVRAQSPVQGEAWEMMKHHAWYNACGAVGMLLLVMLWLGSSDRARARLHLVFLILLLAGVAIMAIGAWHGGEMVYRYGVGVTHDKQMKMDHEADSETRSAAAEEATEKHEAIEYFVPPLQTHVVLAGATIAAALAAIGMSLRAGAQARLTVNTPSELSDINYALNENAKLATPYGGASPAAQINALDDATMRVDVQRTPVARWWMIALLLGIATLLLGAWTLADDARSWKINDLWSVVQNNNESHDYRRLAHIGVGAAIVLVLLLLTLIGRFVAVRRLILSLFVLLTFVAVAAQVWFGALLLLDTPVGSLGNFNSAMNVESKEPAATTTAPATMPSSVIPLPPTTAKLTTAPTTR